MCSTVAQTQESDTMTLKEGLNQLLPTFCLGKKVVLSGNVKIGFRGTFKLYLGDSDITFPLLALLNYLLCEILSVAERPTNPPTNSSG